VEDQKIIAVSKTKLLLLIGSACLFVACGYWMLQRDPAEIASHRHSPLVVHGMGFLSIVLFGLAGLICVRKLFDRRPGLVLNSEGLTDYSSGSAVRFVPWSEITGFSAVDGRGPKILIVNVANPDKYIEAGGPIRRRFNRINAGIYGGSPIAITSPALKIGFNELVDLCNEYLARFGGRANDALSARAERQGFPLLSGRLMKSTDPRTKLLSWSPKAVKGTMGVGGLGILMWSAASLDKLHIPVWAAVVICLLPMLIFVFATPDMPSIKTLKIAQWIAVSWYFSFATLSFSVALHRGFERSDAFFLVFVLIGALPCVVAIRGLRAYAAYDH